MFISLTSLWRLPIQAIFFQIILNHPRFWRLWRVLLYWNFNFSTSCCCRKYDSQGDIACCWSFRSCFCSGSFSSIVVCVFKRDLIIWSLAKKLYWRKTMFFWWNSPLLFSRFSKLVNRFLDFQTSDKFNASELSSGDVVMLLVVIDRLTSSQVFQEKL